MNGIFVDSNCWLYLLLEGQDPAKESRLRERLAGRRDLVISTQVITEVAANLVKKGHMPEDQLMLRLAGLRGTLVSCTSSAGRRTPPLRGSAPLVDSPTGTA